MKAKRGSVKRGGIREAGPGNSGENRKPVRSNTRNFHKTAKRSHGLNDYVPMRGGIRL